MKKLQLLLVALALVSFTALYSCGGASKEKKEEATEQVQEQMEEATEELEEATPDSTEVAEEAEVEATQE